MYLREVKLEELVDWLLKNRYSEINEVELAQALIKQFDILIHSMKS